MARLFAVERPLPGARAELAILAARLGGQAAAHAHPSDFAQALFDLGATVCTSAAPACVLCPWREPCLARARGIAATLPRKDPRRPRPLRHGAAFVLQDGTGQVLLRRRPPRGLLGGMTELPGTPWRDAPWPEAEALALAPAAAGWRHAGVAEHGFTHFALRLDVYAATLPAVTAEGFLRLPEALAGEALPTLMRRVAAVGLAPATSGSGE